MFLYTSVYSNYLRMAKEDEEETLKAQLLTYKDQVSILFGEHDHLLTCKLPYGYDVSILCY